MAASSHKTARFVLPGRIRNEREAPSEPSTRMALIDRIADLQGIETVECSGDTVPSQVNVYLRQGSTGRSRDRAAPALFCSLNGNTVAVSGLDQWAKYQVIARGWGQLALDHVDILLPRNTRELNVVWKILQRAYANLNVPSVGAAGTQLVSTWDYPKYSRTTLQ